MIELAIYLTLGAAAGVLAGLFGIGGGLVIVPVLAWVFGGQGMDGAIIMHLAIGTSLATIWITSVASIRAHHRRGAVQWPLVRSLLPGVVAGALFGAYIADLLPTPGLKRLFGVFEILVALQMLFVSGYRAHFSLPGRIGLGGAGAIIGTVSALLGIGGGTLTVPYLVWCRVTMLHAVATAAACGLPIAIAGGVGFLVAGWGRAELPDFATGYIYWPAFFGVALASSLTAALGARLAHALPTLVLRRLFAGLLLLIGGKMLLV